MKYDPATVTLSLGGRCPAGGENLAGRTILHYHLGPLLGRGGMGVVYQADDLKLRPVVALKFLSQELAASVRHRARFMKEAMVVSALNHPNIATIHAVEEDQGYQFLVLEYLPGGTLREKIVASTQEGGLPRLEWGVRDGHTDCPRIGARPRSRHHARGS